MLQPQSPRPTLRNTFTNTNTFTNAPIFSSLTSGGLAVMLWEMCYKAATTTAGTGLTYSGNAFNVNTTQNITTLSNLSSGVVSSNSGALYNSATTTLSTSGPALVSPQIRLSLAHRRSRSLSRRPIAQPMATSRRAIGTHSIIVFPLLLSGLFDKGYFFSTTSANYFLSVNQGAAFSTTSANYWSSLGLGFSTTSAINFVKLFNDNSEDIYCQYIYQFKYLRRRPDSLKSQRPAPSQQRRCVGNELSRRHLWRHRTYRRSRPTEISW